MKSEATTQAPPLHETDPQWLGQLASGMSWLVWGILGSLLFTAGTVAMAAQVILYSYQKLEAGENATYEELTPLWMMVATSLGLVVLSVVFLVGSWKATAPEPGRQTTAPSLAMTRWTCVPAFAMNIPASLALLGAGNIFIAISSLGIKLIALSLLSIGFPASLIYLRFLARRIPAPSLARQTSIVFWGQFVAGLLLVACLIAATLYVISEFQRNAGLDLGPNVGLIFLPGLLSIFAFLVWWIVLMFVYRSRFAQAHRKSLAIQVNTSD